MLLNVLAIALLAQTPQPFPRPGEPKPAPAQTPAVQPPTVAPGVAPAGTPNEASLGVPIYPAATFLASYDAGQGQRYYLFGSTAPFADSVAYYRRC